MAWTTPRTWTDTTDVPDAAMMNTHIRDNLNALPEYVLARKTADQSVTSNDVPSSNPDQHLFFTMGANQTWYLHLVVWIVDNSGGTGDARFKMTVPASATSTMSASYFNDAGTMVANSFTQASDCTPGVTPSAGQVQEYFGFATTGGTAGNWQFQWAQAVSAGSSLIVKKGSFLGGYQIA